MSDTGSHSASCQCEECQENCPHDSHDHGECIDCGKDVMDILIMKAEYEGEGDR